MKTLLSICGILFLLATCKRPEPRIDYANQQPSDSLTIDKIVTDTTKILIAELPVLFDSADYLIHTIVLKDLNNKNREKFIGSGSYSSSSYSDEYSDISGWREDNFSGDMSNLIFENIKTGNQHLLTNKLINITYIQYLKELSKKIKKQYILYTVYDMDSNRDKKINSNDIESLYISNIDGTNFRKLTLNPHDYYQGKLILENLKYYFITIEDINNDGIFNNTDKSHYYYIDFSTDSNTVTEYNPLKLLTK